MPRKDSSASLPQIVEATLNEAEAAGKVICSQVRGPLLSELVYGKLGRSLIDCDFSGRPSYCVKSLPNCYQSTAVPQDLAPYSFSSLLSELLWTSL